MKLRKFLASLIIVAISAGSPVGAAAVSAGPDCATMSSAATDGDCCGGVDMASCSIACPTLVAVAAVDSVADRFPPVANGMPLQCAAARARSVARAPDTPPPKAFSA